MNTDSGEQVDAVAWQVLHARPRCEKKLAEYCVGLELTHYLPLRIERRVYQRRKVEVQKPLFPGYMFARFDREQRLALLRSQLLVRTLPIADQAGFLAEVEQIRQALCVNPELTACPAVRNGDAVRIVQGPFRGLEGVVCAVRGETRVVLNVYSIGKGVAIEATLDMLERL